MWADKSYYEGRFVHSVMCGEGSAAGDMRYVGTYVWSDGRSYVGEWKDNKMHGRGTFTFTGGKIYIGQFINDKRHGMGKMIWFYFRVNVH